MITPQHPRKTLGNLIIMPVRIDATYLTVEEVAHLLRNNQRTVRKLLTDWRDSGGQEGLPGGFKLGGKRSDWRVDRQILEDWIKAQTMVGISVPETTQNDVRQSVRQLRNLRP